MQAQKQGHRPPGPTDFSATVTESCDAVRYGFTHRTELGEAPGGGASRARRVGPCLWPVREAAHRLRYYSHARVYLPTSSPPLSREAWEHMKISLWPGIQAGFAYIPPRDFPCSPQTPAVTHAPGPSSTHHQQHEEATWGMGGNTCRSHIR